MGTSQRRGRFRLRDDTSPQGRRGRGPPGCAFQEAPRPSVGLPPGPAAPAPRCHLLSHPLSSSPSCPESPPLTPAVHSGGSLSLGSDSSCMFTECPRAKLPA